MNREEIIAFYKRQPKWLQKAIHRALCDIEWRSFLWRKARERRIAEIDARIDKLRAEIRELQRFNIQEGIYGCVDHGVFVGDDHNRYCPLCSLYGVRVGEMIE